MQLYDLYLIRHNMANQYVILKFKIRLNEEPVLLSLFSAAADARMWAAAFSCFSSASCEESDSLVYDPSSSSKASSVWVYLNIDH
jgi:hypothetical protein